MPTYDYLCAACGHVFEVFEKISDESVKACLKCGKKKAKRKITAPAGLIFKGSGFYVTDKGGSKSPPAANDVKKKTTRKTVSKPESEGGKSDKTEKK